MLFPSNITIDSLFYVIQSFSIISQEHKIANAEFVVSCSLLMSKKKKQQDFKIWGMCISRF